MADHTQLPWKAKPAAQYGDGFSIGNDDSNAAFVPGYQDHPHIRANVELIIKACNNHDALMLALENARRDLLSLKSRSDTGSARDRRIEAAAARIAETLTLPSQRRGGPAGE